jgi:hypothetical protein
LKRKRNNFRSSVWIETAVHTIGIEANRPIVEEHFPFRMTLSC